MQEQVVDRRLELEGRGALTLGHLRLAVAAARTSPRTLQHRLRTAREEGRTTPRSGRRRRDRG
ncbi:hypothetical protein [Embleya sp. NPDC020886]|uniref:hypothetical protein n=1 Tax=Embleya sp. NPDC020886 TaxID=3363980 RepID=UPI00379B9761